MLIVVPATEREVMPEIVPAEMVAVSATRLSIYAVLSIQRSCHSFDAEPKS
jgi:hypothetical protein